MPVIVIIVGDLSLLLVPSRPVPLAELLLTQRRLRATFTEVKSVTSRPCRHMEWKFYAHSALSNHSSRRRNPNRRNCGGIIIDRRRLQGVFLISAQLKSRQVLMLRVAPEGWSPNCDSTSDSQIFQLDTERNQADSSTDFEKPMRTRPRQT